MITKSDQISTPAYDLDFNHWDKRYIFSSTIAFRENSEDLGQPYEVPAGVWLLYTSFGSYKLRVNETTHSMNAPDCGLLVSKYPIKVAFSLDDSEEAETIGAFFNWQWLHDLCSTFTEVKVLDSFEHGRFSKILIPKSLQSVRTALTTTTEALTKPNVSKLLIEAKARECVAHIVLDHYMRNQDKSALLSKHEEDLLQRTVNYIEKNLSSSLTAPLISDRMNAGTRTLNAIFKVGFGKSVSAYISSRRMEVAFSLIEDQGYSVSMAAYEVGLTPNYLSSAFHDQFGIHPSKLGYRSRQKQ